MVDSPDGSTRLSTVLIVEDDETVQRLLRMAFTVAGFSVIQSSTGTEALLKIEKDLPSAVVLDLGLPDRRGGDVLDHLRQAPDGPAWCAISAMDLQNVTQQYGDLRGHFLAKPFDPWILVDRIARDIPESAS